ncbi:MAG: protein phosphatase 2C domain-containing protein [Castellaniella sp.]|uniref:PP2C family protein-serine/threonine phosphatase n=1 Tax=Castellaniella sp. TaxID=1955812 RepID=UPI003C76D767
MSEIVASQASQRNIEELGLAMATHIGLKRSRNDDRIAVSRIVAPNAETYTVAFVCDGVGGLELGNQAAALAIANIITDLAQQQARLSLDTLAVQLVRRADDFVRQELQGRGATTLVMLLAAASRVLVCANVGDSRAYSWNPSTGKLQQITVDDTIENELRNLPGNPDALIKARGLQGRLSQAVGESGRSSDELRVQIYKDEHFRAGAILGSDGLWRVAKDFEAAVAGSVTPQEATRRAISLANWVGGVDNASSIAVGNLDLLYGLSHAELPVNFQRPEITLWSPSAKIKFITRDWLEGETPAEVPVKAEKAKRGVKKRAGRRAENATQQGKEQIDLKKEEEKPKIEITIHEEQNKLI